MRQCPSSNNCLWQPQLFKNTWKPTVTNNFKACTPRPTQIPQPWQQSKKKFKFGQKKITFENNWEHLRNQKYLFLIWKSKGLFTRQWKGHPPHGQAEIKNENNKRTLFLSHAQYHEAKAPANTHWLNAMIKFISQNHPNKWKICKRRMLLEKEI